MPAIQVAKTDTLEQQRVKINSISSQIFNISAGGTDLSTGNLKLGDGSLSSPSLGFLNDSTTGIFRPDVKTMAFVSDAKKIYQFDGSGTYFFRNFKVQKKVISNVTINNAGQNYDTGTYSAIAHLGGSGAGATFDLTVSAYSGITTPGSGYTFSSGGGGGAGGGTSQYTNIPLQGGSGTGSIASLIFSNGGFSATTITTYGTGYAKNDVLTAPTSKNNITVTIASGQSNITVASTTGYFVGMVLTKVSGTPSLTTPNDPQSGQPQPLVVQQIVDSTTIATNGTGSASGNAVYNFTVPWGSGTGYQYTINKVGIVTAAAVNNGGNGYDQGDLLTFYNLDLTKSINYTVGTQAVTEVTFTGTVPSSAFVVGNNYTFTSTGPSPSNSTVTVVEKQTSGSNITSILVVIVGMGSVGAGATSGAYTVATADAENQYTIDFGSGATRVPNFTILKDNLYKLAVPGGHPFRFSIHPRGIWNKITKSAVTTSTSSSILSIASTTGILVGMTVEKDTSVVGETGSYATGTTVIAVSANSVTLSAAPTASGTATTIFKGAQYDASNVVYGSSEVTIRPSADTPATLYYYCTAHDGMGGNTGYEATVTVSQVNPKTFGSELELLVSAVTVTDSITANVADGSLTVSAITGTTVAATSINSSTATIPALTSSTSVTTPLVTTSGNLSLTAGATSNVAVSALALTVGSEFTVTSSTGNLQTSGQIKTTGSFNSNDVLSITNNIISTSGTSDILLTPSTGRVGKVNTTTAFVIPSGTTAERPNSPIAQNGAIRYNTSTQQYEGYSGSTSSWTSLGGVRDLDGNTYILAEASVGANDNTLYFYNDGNNTVKFTPTYQDFVTAKKIRSTNTSAPANVTWTSNTPVTAGQYLKYRNNIYLVVTSGVTGTSGNEPTDTSGNNFANGTSTLKWYISAVASLTFEEIDELKIGPLGDTPLTVGGDLRITKNTIATDISDLVLKPLAGKKVDIQSTSSLVLPSGTSAQRGVPGQGSVRYNTTITQFEGYNGSNWTSLGGVKDVDGNTYIIPETAPGANENILYFYNNGSNTLRLSTTELTFDTIDQIGSTSNNLDIQAQTVTFNSLALTIDNSSTSTKFLSTKTNIDLALSVGLYTDPLIRLNNTGDIYINKTFGTGTNTLVKVLENELKSFELDDVKIETAEYTLTKGTTNSGASAIFDPTVHSAAKVVITANNVTADHREIYEMTVTSKNSDIFYTEYGNVTTGQDIISTLFDFDAGGKVRLTATLTSSVSAGNVINVTVASTIIKK